MESCKFARYGMTYEKAVTLLKYQQEILDEAMLFYRVDPEDTATLSKYLKISNDAILYCRSKDLFELYRENNVDVFHVEDEDVGNILDMFLYDHRADERDFIRYLIRDVKMGATINPHRYTGFIEFHGI